MKRFTLLVACGVALASMHGVPAAAQTPEPYSGAADFQVFCASCHGASAKGDGTLAASLRKRPADLTQLSKKHDGVYPADAVFATIEGGHERNDMPAWSGVLEKAHESSGPEAARARIRSLVKYLETLQPKP
jgi:mono/diheme cytochrome c family protein